MSRLERATRRLNCYLTESTMRQLDELAERNGLTRSGALTFAVREMYRRTPAPNGGVVIGLKRVHTRRRKKNGAQREAE